MSQFDDRDGSTEKTTLKNTLRVLANSNMSDEAIMVVLSQLCSQPVKQPQYNSQFGDH